MTVLTPGHTVEFREGRVGQDRTGVIREAIKGWTTVLGDGLRSVQLRSEVE